MKVKNRLVHWKIRSCRTCYSQFEAVTMVKILLPVVEFIPYYYSIRLVGVASRKGILDLEKWLNNNLTTYKDAFFEVLKSHTDLVTSGLLSEELESLHISIIDSNPRLQNRETTDSPTST